MIRENVSMATNGNAMLHCAVPRLWSDEENFSHFTNVKLLFSLYYIFFNIDKNHNGYTHARNATTTHVKREYINSCPPVRRP